MKGLKNKKGRRIVFLVFLLLIAVCFLSLELIFDRTLVLSHPPTEYPNTIWECQGYDMYFIVDNENNSILVSKEDGDARFFNMDWGHKHGLHFFELKVNPQGQLIEDWSEGRYSNGEIHRISDYSSNLRRGIVRITSDPHDGLLYDIQESVTLTFIHAGEIPPVDIFELDNPDVREIKKQ